MYLKYSCQLDWSNVVCVTNYYPRGWFQVIKWKGYHESRANSTTDGAGEGVSDSPHKDFEPVGTHSDNSN